MKELILLRAIEVIGLDQNAHLIYCDKTGQSFLMVFGDGIGERM